MSAAVAAPTPVEKDKKKQKPSALRSIIAGSSAGAVEIAITYPAEFAKTRTQLNTRLPDGKKLPWPPFGKQWYAGCTTLIIGNSAKAAIRKLDSSLTRTPGRPLSTLPVHADRRTVLPRLRLV